MEVEIVLNPKPGKKPTLRDIARRVGCSIATVSAVLNDVPPADTFSEETRRAVREAAAELGYEPNALAQALKKAPENRIGVVVYSQENPFFATVLHAAREQAAAAGFEMLVLDMGNDAERLVRCLHVLRSWRVRGVLLILGGHIRADATGLVEESPVPVVAVASRHAAGAASTVSYEDYRAGRAVGDYLLRLGHTRIGVLAGHPSHVQYADRLSGIRAALSDAGRPPEDCRTVRADTSRFALTAGYGAARALLDSRPDTTAVVCMDDILAIGAMKHFHERGCGIPGDLSVTGFDDFLLDEEGSAEDQLGAFLWPSLTTMRTPLRAMGRAAAEMLVECIGRGGAGGPENRSFAGELVVRESTGPPRGGRATN